MAKYAAIKCKVQKTAYYIITSGEFDIQQEYREAHSPMSLYLRIYIGAFFNFNVSMLKNKGMFAMFIKLLKHIDMIVFLN